MTYNENPEEDNFDLNKDWQIVFPKTIEEVRDYLQHPKCHTSMVVYKQKQLMFLLNPFGNGVCNTGELKLSDNFDIGKISIDDIIIIIKKGK